MNTRLAVAWVLMLYPAASFADVLPSRRPPPQEQQALEERLVDVGLARAEASQEAALVSSADAAFFAERPERLRIAGHGGELVWLGCCCASAIGVLVWLLLIL